MTSAAPAWARPLPPRGTLLDDDALLGRDDALIGAVAPWIERTITRYHRATVSGLERLPKGRPVLFVGNHNGGTYSGDSWIFAAALIRERGVAAAPHGLAHDLVMRLPVITPTLRRIGCVPAHPGHAQRLLELGRNVIVYPGGDMDALRPFRARNEVRFGGRSGFVRTAIRAGVPIVPVAAQGAHATFVVLDDLQGLSRLLGLDQRLRFKVFPATLLLPWGLVLGPTPPYLPLPSRIQVELLDPIEPAGDPEDDAWVAAEALRIQGLIEGAVRRMAGR